MTLGAYPHKCYLYHKPSYHGSRNHVGEMRKYCNRVVGRTALKQCVQDVTAITLMNSQQLLTPAQVDCTDSNQSAFQDGWEWGS